MMHFPTDREVLEAIRARVKVERERARRDGLPVPFIVTDIDALLKEAVW